ncbi:MAG TPA: hypothetical protein VF510_07690 [Ktedonobacterales bacterium]
MDRRANGQTDRQPIATSAHRSSRHASKQSGDDTGDNMLAHDPTVRPGGVTFIALLTNFSGLISIVVAALGLLGFTSPTIQGRHANPPAALAVLIIDGVLGVGYVIVAGGLWRLRRWAFWTAIVISVLLVKDRGH